VVDLTVNVSVTTTADDEAAARALAEKTVSDYLWYPGEFDEPVAQVEEVEITVVSSSETKVKDPDDNA
jgi:hypothetical protein